MTLAMNQDFFQWFGKRCEIKCRSFRRRIGEGELFGQNGFAGAWRAHDDADRIFRNTTEEHIIKPGASGWYFLNHQDLSPQIFFSEPGVSPQFQSTILRQVAW